MKKVRLTFDCSRELHDALGDLAERMGGLTMAEVLRRAIALMAIAVDAKEQGNHLSLCDSNGVVLYRVVLA